MEHYCMLTALLSIHVYFLVFSCARSGDSEWSSEQKTIVSKHGRPLYDGHLMPKHSDESAPESTEDHWKSISSEWKSEEIRTTSNHGRYSYRGYPTGMNNDMKSSSESIEKFWNAKPDWRMLKTPMVPHQRHYSYGSQPSVWYDDDWSSSESSSESTENFWPPRYREEHKHTILQHGKPSYTRSQSRMRTRTLPYYVDSSPGSNGKFWHAKSQWNSEYAPKVMKYRQPLYPRGVNTDSSSSQLDFDSTEFDIRSVLAPVSFPGHAAFRRSYQHPHHHFMHHKPHPYQQIQSFPNGNWNKPLNRNHISFKTMDHDMIGPIHRQFMPQYYYHEESNAAPFHKPWIQYSHDPQDFFPMHYKPKYSMPIIQRRPPLFTPV